jgi:hypothetical protein
MTNKSDKSVVKNKSMHKRLSQKELAKIEIQVSEKGFTVWVVEDIMVGKKKRKIKYWILDGSCLKEDGEIRFGRHGLYNVNAVFNKRSFQWGGDTIVIQKMGTKNKSITK